MPLEREPFVNTKTSEERESQRGRTIGVWFNDEELEQLKEYGLWLHQEKPATIIKQMIQLGAELASNSQSTLVRDLVFNNVRKNKRLGIEIVEPKLNKS